MSEVVAGIAVMLVAPLRPSRVHDVVGRAFIQSPFTPVQPFLFIDTADCGENTDEDLMLLLTTVVLVSLEIFYSPILFAL